MKRKSLRILIVSLFTVPALFSLAAALMIGLSTEDLTRSSDVVLQGEVVDVAAYWSEDGKIMTRATVRKDIAVRGSITEERVVVEYEGGEIGDIGMKVSDVATLRKGEKVLLFLKSSKNRKNEAVHSIVGKAQGKYTVGEDGIARKKGYSLESGGGVVDNDIPAERLIEKIRMVK